jgi:hypothetical protein
MSKEQLAMNDKTIFKPSKHIANCSLVVIPPLVTRLMPTAQLKHTLQFMGMYTETINRLYLVVKDMPRLGDTVTIREPTIYLHYFTGTADYFICEYDGEDTMFGKVSFRMFPSSEKRYQKFSLSSLKSNQFLELDFGWEVSSISN